MERYFQILGIAFEAVIANKFRSILTALGIIFGVAAVIAMMAIGNGAQQEILDQMKLVGVNNIVITPKLDIADEESEDTDEESTEEESETESKGLSSGLTLKDMKSIQKIIPDITRVSPEVSYEVEVVSKGNHGKT